MKKNILVFLMSASFTMACLVMHISCAAFRGAEPEYKGPSYDPSCPGNKILSYNTQTDRFGAFMLKLLPEDTLRHVIEQALQDVFLCREVLLSREIDGFVMSTGFQVPRPDKSVDHLYIRIDCLIHMKQTDHPAMRIDYCLAWTRKKGRDWHYNDFPIELQKYRDALFDSLLGKMNAIIY